MCDICSLTLYHTYLMYWESPPPMKIVGPEKVPVWWDKLANVERLLAIASRLNFHLKFSPGLWTRLIRMKFLSDELYNYIFFQVGFICKNKLQKQTDICPSHLCRLAEREASEIKNSTLNFVYICKNSSSLKMGHALFWQWKDPPKACT